MFEFFFFFILISRVNSLIVQIYLLFISEIKRCVIFFLFFLLDYYVYKYNIVYIFILYVYVYIKRARDIYVNFFFFIVYFLNSINNNLIFLQNFEEEKKKREEIRTHFCTPKKKTKRTASV